VLIGQHSAVISGITAFDLALLESFDHYSERAKPDIFGSIMVRAPRKQLLTAKCNSPSFEITMVTMVVLSIMMSNIPPSSIIHCYANSGVMY
jgi:hypothetical protein